MAKPRGKNRRRRYLLIAAFALVFLITTCTVLLALAIDANPIVVDAETIDPRSAMQARDLAKRTLDEILNAAQPVTLSATAEEFNGLIALGARALPRLTGRVNVTRLGLLGALTVELPPNPFGRYLNIYVQINPSRAGLDIEYVRIGQIKIPGTLARATLRLVLDLTLGNQQGALFLDAVQGISLEQDLASLYLAPPPDLKLRLQRTRGRLKGYRDKVALLGDPQRVRFYYQHLIELNRVYGDFNEVSLDYYLGPLLKEAGRRSEQSAPEIENQAALLALAIYLGSYRFESLIGPVRTEEMKAHRPPRRVVLAGRGDLRLHFIFSAALKLAADKGISFAIGEFKELLDSGSGGSGFSFADLAADRAGTRFATWATDKNGGAWQLQREMSGEITEASFFPDISELPEGLSDNEFISLYGGVNAAPYKAMVAKIDSRLDKLAVYRQKAKP